MKANQRVIRSIPDRAGRVYTKTGESGKTRMQAATRYMDKRENVQLYTLQDGQFLETDRHTISNQINETQTNYQQHVAFTTKLQADKSFVNEREAAEFVARAIQERRPDAEIYAVAVHSDAEKNENGVHVHATFGTRTTLRHADLTHFRHKSFELEQTLERDNMRELSHTEREWIMQRQAERQAIQSRNKTNDKVLDAALPPHIKVYKQLQNQRDKAAEREL